MQKLMKNLSAVVICTVFATMQVNAAIDTGLGVGNGGAVIHGTTGGFAGVDKGTNSATLKFNNNTHVDWDTLNVNKGETLNFNAVGGAKDLTVLNTVRTNMSQFYGNVNANAGIGKLIISNPNGMLFDGAKVTTAGDVMLTTQALGATFKDTNMQVTGLPTEAVNAVTIKDSNFIVGGGFNIVSPSVEVIKGAIKADAGVKFITADGQNYLVAPTTNNDVYHKAVRMESVSIDGDVYIASGKDIVTMVNGGEVKGNLTINSDGNVAVNYANEGQKLHVTGDVNIDTDARTLYLRDSKVDGNVKMHNSGGFLEVKNIDVAKNVDLKTTVESNKGVKHFVHVVGDNKVAGNMNIDSIHNIHIGGYDQKLETLQPGSLNVKGNLNALAREGSVTVTVDTSADKVALESGTLNILTDGKAVIKANEYQFKANKYIGGIDSEKEVIRTMENYLPIPTVKNKSFVNIEGGKVTKIETAGDGFAFVRANKDMTVNGINAHKVNLASDQHDIIIGKDNHADLIQVDGDTKNLTVELPANSRDYTLKYTNIKDTEVITISPETKITYEMANGKNGWNKGTQTRDNTFLVVPGSPVPPPPKPDPDPDPNPNPDPESERNLVKVINPADVDTANVYTPIAFAADLDDEIDTGVRKNVDGSVTVVRPYTPQK